MQQTRARSRRRSRSSAWRSARQMRRKRSRSRSGRCCAARTWPRWQRWSDSRGERRRPHRAQRVRVAEQPVMPLASPQHAKARARPTAASSCWAGPRRMTRWCARPSGCWRRWCRRSWSPRHRLRLSWKRVDCAACLRLLLVCMRWGVARCVTRWALASRSSIAQRPLWVWHQLPHWPRPVACLWSPTPFQQSLPRRLRRCGWTAPAMRSAAVAPPSRPPMRSPPLQSAALQSPPNPPLSP
mmetsp:Transcript_91631/g.275114  ORF Transcript_91631/g.275114 Transcript_91631/m.275114 type:complete len:241 (+) Transcript_91631:54-776(+)